MDEPDDVERASLHQVANLLAIIETQTAVVNAADDPAERGRLAEKALQWIEQSGRETQRWISVWREQLSRRSS